MNRGFHISTASPESSESLRLSSTWAGLSRWDLALQVQKLWAEPESLGSSTSLLSHSFAP